MTLQELRTSIRNTLDDVSSSPFWTNTEINEYINEGYNILCRSTKIIKDSVTSSICTLALAIGNQNIAISPLILTIERCKPSWTSGNLLPSFLSEFDYDNADWLGTSGTPTAYCLDYSDGYLTLNKAMAEVATLGLTVRRMPLSDLIIDTDTPEIPAKYHWMLKDYALYRAFMKQDSEIYNPEKAITHKRLFMGDDETSPGGHILRIITENDPLPSKRIQRYF